MAHDHSPRRGQQVPAASTRRDTPKAYSPHLSRREDLVSVLAEGLLALLLTDQRTPSGTNSKSLMDISSKVSRD